MPNLYKQKNVKGLVTYWTFYLEVNNKFIPIKVLDFSTKDKPDKRSYYRWRTLFNEARTVTYDKETKQICIDSEPKEPVQ